MSEHVCVQTNTQDSATVHGRQYELVHAPDASTTMQLDALLRDFGHDRMSAFTTEVEGTVQSLINAVRGCE